MELRGGDELMTVRCLLVMLLDLGRVLALLPFSLPLTRSGTLLYELAFLCGTSAGCWRLLRCHIDWQLCLCIQLICLADVATLFALPWTDREGSVLADRCSDLRHQYSRHTIMSPGRKILRAVLVMVLLASVKRGASFMVQRAFKPPQ